MIGFSYSISNEEPAAENIEHFAEENKEHIAAEQNNENIEMVRNAYIIHNILMPEVDYNQPYTIVIHEAESALHLAVALWAKKKGAFVIGTFLDKDASDLTEQHYHKIILHLGKSDYKISREIESIRNDGVVDAIFTSSGIESSASLARRFCLKKAGILVRTDDVARLTVRCLALSVRLTFFNLATERELDEPSAVEFEEGRDAILGVFAGD